MRAYRVWHRTAYTYSKPVQDSVGQFHLVPRPLPWQRVEASDVVVSPPPEDLSADRDYFGNSSTYFHVTDPHDELTITSSSEVTVDDPVYDQGALDQPWERARPLLHPEVPGAWRATEYALESTRARHVSEATAYGAESLTPGRPLGEAATDLMQRIFRDFTYDKTATTVTSTVADAMRKRAGVCQDFAHVAISCLRGLGLPVRYVSGYLETLPPPGQVKLQGADASHAWFSVLLPDHGWIDFDPTNDKIAAEQHITTAVGRDFQDVTPLRGIFYGGGGHELRVAVDVNRIAEPLPETV